MTPPRIGSLFSGYGGLDMGIRLALGGEVVWHSDIDKGANKILAHRYPDIPNLGDITKIDWAEVPPIDVLTGGFPCQDLSHAGKKAGLKPGTRSGLWEHMAYAIHVLKPRLVVAENVRGLLNAEAHSDMEPCPWCLGDGGGVTPLRALGAVLGDLAELGYDARWHGLRAADVGAPHGRFRVFVLAYPRGRAAVDAGDDAGAAAEGAQPRQVARLAEPAGDRGPAELARVQGGPGGGEVGDDGPGGRGLAADAPAERPVVPEPGVGRPTLTVVRERPGERAGGRGAGPDAEGGDAGAPVGQGGLPREPRGVGVGPGGSGGGDGAAAADGAAGRGLAVPDAGGERHGRGEVARAVGRVERGRDDASPDARPAAVDRRPGPEPDGSPTRVAEGLGWPEPDGRVPERPAAERPAADAGRVPGEPRRGAGPGEAEGGGSRGEPGRRDGEGPAAAPAGDAEGVEQRERVLGVVQQPADGPAGGGPAGEAARGANLPTPSAGDSVGTGYATDPDELTRADGRHRLRDAANVVAQQVQWGRYEPAIRRWEHILGRPAPAPTEPSEKGHRLSPAFVEWMMGLPEGHVCDVPDMSRAEKLKALGNGVVPQQAAIALTLMMRGVAR